MHERALRRPHNHEQLAIVPSQMQVPLQLHALVVVRVEFHDLIIMT